LSPGRAVDGSRQMPGAFDVSGTGTSDDPFVVAGDTGNSTPQSNTSTSSANTGEGDRGITDRLRRGWFGGPSQ
jgi:fission 1 protein/division protein 1